MDAEVVGFAGERTFLMPSTEVQGLLPNARVVPKSGEGLVAVGDALLGRVIDGEGVPLDGRGELRLDAATKLLGTDQPLQREPIQQSLDVGVRDQRADSHRSRSACGLVCGSGVGNRPCWA